MFELNDVTLPLDVDDLSVTERIDKATAKMRKALKSVKGKQHVERNIVAAMKVWCNELFADDCAGEMLLGFTSLRKILDTTAEIAAKIGRLRTANTVNASRAISERLEAETLETSESPAEYADEPTVL